MDFLKKRSLIALVSKSWFWTPKVLEAESCGVLRGKLFNIKNKLELD